MRALRVVGPFVLASVLLSGCESDEILRPLPPPDDGIYGFAHGCYAIEGFDGGDAVYLSVTPAGDAFSFSAPSIDTAARFRLQPSDLGAYVLFDLDGRYFTAEPDGGGGYRFGRPATLDTELSLLVDGYVSAAEWSLEPSARDGARYQLRHRQTGAWTILDGLTDTPAKAAVITLVEADGCSTYPELSLDAEGEVEPRSWPDGDLFGIAEIHSHILTNRGFGGGSTFHGAPFHPLGAPYALPDCAPWHGVEGRRDVVGFFSDGGVGELDIDVLAQILTSGEAPSFNHETAGYPAFTAWPNSWGSATHQTMYYRWIERAYLAGLRLVVQHATGNSVLCDLVTGINAQTSLYDCNDMVSVDRTLADARALERYVDAQAGGPGQGWLRIVESPAQAREVIAEGKLAMVLGIEISNVFDCFITPRPGFEPCTIESVEATIDRYRDLGVRVVFPVHKFDNAFSAGDGSGGIIELGNVVNTGHYSSFVEDCPGFDTSFDGGDVTFGGLNEPRDVYDAPPPLDTSRFGEQPLPLLLSLLDRIQQPPLEGDWCQRFGLTDLGERLLQALMERGMMVDIAHLPERGLARAFEVLEANAYPALKTHGSTNMGRVYQNGGLGGARLGRCAAPGEPGAIVRAYADQVEARAAAGEYPSEALSFDLNGFAGGPRPRFGDDSGCGEAQENPVTYPFRSYDGRVTFTEPRLGERTVDFNTEGMIHIGLLPEYIEDARRDGASDADLEPLFRSAEAFVRHWERAEARGAALRGSSSPEDPAR